MYLQGRHTDYFFRMFIKLLESRFKTVFLFCGQMCANNFGFVIACFDDNYNYYPYKKVGAKI
jgi:hypothetical protein